jgi:transcriptional regulator with XRE-family HTH domain
MVIFCQHMETFGEWLRKELDRRKISQKELADLSGITPAQISRVISGTRGPGTDLIQSIARALNLPPEEVYRAAGLLPPTTNPSPLDRLIIHLMSTLPEEEKQDVIKYIQLRASIAEERGSYAAKPKTKPAKS